MDRAVSHHEYLIIGAGPAGLQLAYYLQKAGRDYLVLESGQRAGAFFEKFPRHRKLISINKVHTGYDDSETNLRWDWNSLLSGEEGPLFKEYTEDYFPNADAIVDYFGDYAEQFELNIAFDAAVEKVSRDGRFELTLADGRRYSCDRLVAATGVSKPYIPDIPGMDLVEQYVDMSLDPREFANQRVLVLGKGNSALETADHLVGAAALIHVLSPTPIKLAWKTHFVGHLRAVNNNFLDTYQLKSQNAVLDATIHSIEKRDGKLVVSVTYGHAQGETEELVYDRVLGCTGFRFDASMFDPSCRPELTINQRFPRQTSTWESVNVPDLYFAGTIMQMRDFKKTTSGFIHGFRYNVRTLYHLMEEKYHRRPLPMRPVEATPEGLAEALLNRINCTSALWQQFGFLGDQIAISPDRENASYREELPVDYIHESELGQHPDYYILTLEFGKVTGDPFHIERKPDPAQADESVFLHPVIRHYSGSSLRGELHLLENLFAEWWDEELHRKPLVEFLRRQMTRDAAWVVEGAEAVEEVAAG